MKRDHWKLIRTPYPHALFCCDYKYVCCTLWKTLYFMHAWPQNLAHFHRPLRDMEKSKTKPIFNSLVFSTLFLSFVCFAGLIRVEIELHAHRQMLQVLNQPIDEKLVLKNTANDEKTNEMNILYSEKGGFKHIKLRRVERLLTRNPCYRAWVML